jgi:hypothetical protein
MGASSLFFGADPSSNHLSGGDSTFWLLNRIHAHRVTPGSFGCIHGYVCSLKQRRCRLSMLWIERNANACANFDEVLTDLKWCVQRCQ